jgi:4-hydroxy-tetrahydrodipicolinate synthase
MEMIAYNIPSCTHSSIDPEVLAHMAREGWIRTCKESSGNIDYFLHVLHAGTDAGLRVLVGDETLIATGLLAGGDGVVPVCGNIFPKLFVDAYRAARAGDTQTLFRLHKKVMHVRDVLPLGSSSWLSGLKYAASLQGIGNGRLIAPQEPAPDDQRQRIKELLDEFKA